MKCMILIAFIMIISIHILKLGSFIFLLLAVCAAGNSVAHDHDHKEIDCEKSKYVSIRSIFTK